MQRNTRRILQNAPIKRSNRRKHMKKSQKASLLLHFSALTLLAVVALFSAAQNASAQELVRGTITLSVTARLGDTDLPPGVYRFSVLSLNTINSVDPSRWATAA
jgi:hypothetical protein